MKNQPITSTMHNFVKITAEGVKTSNIPITHTSTSSHQAPLHTTSERMKFFPTKKIPHYITGYGSQNGLTWRQFFRGDLINKFRVTATLQWTAVVLVGIVYAQKDEGVISLIWERATAPKK
jgi:hypothetical protein